MNKILKTIIMLIFILLFLSVITYAVFKISENKNNPQVIPTFGSELGALDISSQIETLDTNKVWVGTFNLAWNELMDKIVGGPIEFEKTESKLANELNKMAFTKEMLSDNSYYIETGEITKSLRDKIEKNLKEKYNTESEVLDVINWNSKDNEYLIYGMLNKNFTFYVPFHKYTDTFGDSTEKVQYFGLDAPSTEEAFKQVAVLFYNEDNDFAVKIDTKEGEELILYRTDVVTSFDEMYNNVKEKANLYKGRKEMLREKDELRVPFIKLRTDISYDELCNKKIKNTNGRYIKQAIQAVDFQLDNYGGNIKSEAIIHTILCDSMETPRYFDFKDNFVLYMKENDKEKPYFALLVDNTDILVLAE